jgi:predicted Zn-dependent protease
MKGKSLSFISIISQSRGCKVQAMEEVPRKPASLLCFRAMPPLSLTPVEEMAARLERVLAGSPADETEMVWIEARHSQESNGKRRRDSYESQERTVLVRVRESGRIGLHRTGLTGLHDLEKAVREALAQARLTSPSPAAWLPEGAGEALPAIPGLYDPEVPRLTAARVKEIIQKTAESGEVARLGWGEGRFVVVNSRGLRRTTEATAVWLEVSCGQTPGAGHAATVARTLAGLDGPAVFARARRRHAPDDGPAAEPPAGPVPVALAPEAAASLLDLLNRHALSSVSFLDGVSFLCERLGQEAFHPAISLRDDPLAPCGAPFPFDLLGAARRRQDLVERGVFVGPARDERLAHRLGGLPPTPNLVAPDEARAAHLSLQPGGEPDGELLRRADGGVWINELDPLEAFDPRTLRFRTVARGARRIEGGALGAALPDLLWEGCLPSLLGRVLGVGNDPVPVALGDPLLGAVTSPLLALDGVDGLREGPIPRS